MSFTMGLRIFTLVMMGLVVAHAARVLLMALSGPDRLPPRALAGEVLTGLGAFLIGWGLLPGGTADREWLLMLVGSLLWAVGIVLQPAPRGTHPS